MRRWHFVWLCVVLTSATGNLRADVTPGRDEPVDSVHRLLAEAQLSAALIPSPFERNAALNSVGVAYVRAGDETLAGIINKKVETSETPRPILKALAISQLQQGRVDDALFTVRSMNDSDAANATLIALAKEADQDGDAELAVRLCRLVYGEERLDALLLATRIQQSAANFNGTGAAMDAAKLLAHHQWEVSKVAETEALLGNITRAERLMGRLRRESDQARVLAAMVHYEAGQKDFAGAQQHLSDIDSEMYRAAAMRDLAVALADAGQLSEATELAKGIPEAEVEFETYCMLTEAEVQRKGTAAARALAIKIEDGPAKAACLSTVAVLAAQAGERERAAELAKAAHDAVHDEHEEPPDWAMQIICQNLAKVGHAPEAIELSRKMKDEDNRAQTIQAVMRSAGGQLPDEVSRKLVDRLTIARERTAALVGLAEALMDRVDVGESF